MRLSIGRKTYPETYEFLVGGSWSGFLFGCISKPDKGLLTIGPHFFLDEEATKNVLVGYNNGKFVVKSPKNQYSLNKFMIFKEGLCLLSLHEE